MVAHYAASGWLPLSGGDDVLIDLVAQGAQDGFAEVLPDRTEYRVLTDTDRRFELWLYAAYGQVRGAVPYIRGNVKWEIVVDRLLPRITGGMGALEVHRVQDPDFGLCFELPDYGRFKETEIGVAKYATITGLAYLCRTVPADEERFCIHRVYPYGMLNDSAVSAGEGSRCDVLACGRITRVDHHVNPLTQLSVWLLDLDVEGIPLSVAASPEMIDGDEPTVGRLFEGVFWLVGRLDRGRETGTITGLLQRFRSG